MMRNTQLPEEKKTHIPNKILDSMLLKYSDIHDEELEEEQ